MDVHQCDLPFTPDSPNTLACLNACPFEITNIYNNEATRCSAWVIREHDVNGRQPYIYAKVCHATKSQSESGFIVLSDTGCGTATANVPKSLSSPAMQTKPDVCNLRTFLECTINPGGKLPYLIILTHCHWDHILGIGNLLDLETAINPSILSNSSSNIIPTQIVASAKGQLFIEPYSNLQKHSHCSNFGFQAPNFQVTTWAFDFMEIKYSTRIHPPVSANITIIHTQGHTPDSLSWYDAELCVLHVGDSFHVDKAVPREIMASTPQRKTHTTFCLESNLASWWGQMGKILGFVREQNQNLASTSSVVSSLLKDVQDDKIDDVDIETEEWVLVTKSPRVKLLTGHTSPLSDAEEAIYGMKTFMASLLSDEVPSKRVADGFYGEERWLWDYALEGTPCRFSIVAPKVVIERGRKDILQAG